MIVKKWPGEAASFCPLPPPTKSKPMIDNYVKSFGWLMEENTSILHIFDLQESSLHLVLHQLTSPKWFKTETAARNELFSVFCLALYLAVD